MHDALLLDARERQALVSVRSLGQRGLRVATLDAGSRPAAFASRWCVRGWRAPSYERGTDEYLAFLESVLACSPARVLIPSSDGTVALLRAHRERIERHVSIAMAKDPALGIAINKEQTLGLAKQVGVTVPRAVRIASAAEVCAAVHEIGLPAVVKPMESWVQRGHAGTRVGARLVATADEARRAVDLLADRGATAFFFQQFLSGVREAVSLIYARGEVHARFAQRTRRSHPPLGGRSVLRQSIEIPADIGAQAERLVRTIELEGIAEVEFRRDAAGRPYLMEINPRLWASTELAVRAGVDFPFLLYQWASGQKIDFVPGYRVGIWLRHVSDDLETTVASLLQHGRPGIPAPSRVIWDYCSDFFTPTAYEFLDWSDPLPLIWLAAGLVPHAVQQIRKELKEWRVR